LLIRHQRIVHCIIATSSQSIENKHEAHSEVFGFPTPLARVEPILLAPSNKTGSKLAAYSNRTTQGDLADIGLKRSKNSYFLGLADVGKAEACGLPELKNSKVTKTLVL
jgi:hypothetical protein